MRLLGLVLLTFTSTAHAAAGRSCQAHLSRVESARTQRLTAVTELEGILTELNASLSALQEQTGLRENLGFVGRWLGGDADMMASIKAKRVAIESALAKLEDARAALKVAEETVVAEARSFLINNDREFANIVNHQDRLCPMVNAGKNCLTTLQSAIETVSSARTWDMVSGTTDNKGIDYMAAAKTREANEAIEDVKIRIDAYRKALDQYHQGNLDHGVTNANHVEGVDATQQLMFDWITNTGFMDFLNFFRLGKSLEHLEDLEKKISEVHAKMVDAKTTVDGEIAQRIQNARQRH